MDLVTGATGYVGGRLVPRLVEAGRPVRVLAGHLYGYLLYPVQAAIFGNLVRRVADRGRSLAGGVLPGSTP